MTEDLVGHAVMVMVYQEIVYVMAQASALMIGMSLIVVILSATVIA